MLPVMIWVVDRGRNGSEGWREVEWGVDFPEDLIVSSRVPKLIIYLSPPHFPSSHSVLILITIGISSDAINIQNL